MSDHTKIMDKIKKCLALSASSNEHEAAAALRQARKLMEAHSITELDVQAAQAEERRSKSAAKSSPSNWESALAGQVGASFACHVIFTRGWHSGEWRFIGCGASPEIASYTFGVLLRKAKRAREEHIKTKLKRCKTATKTRRADLFSNGWVQSVAGAINAFSGNEQQTTAINAYLANNYPSLGTLKIRDRNDGRKLRDNEYDDFYAGHRSGRDTKLNHGLDGAGQQLAIGNA